MPDEVLLVLTNVPDPSIADVLAARLVEERAAACVNILAPCRSVYRWQGRVETAEEVPVLVKTTRGAYPAVERLIRAGHPYELPEIVAFPVTAGLAAYLEWVGSETGGR
jgi:periplasmic divalent cation tolerance protein